MSYLLIAGASGLIGRQPARAMSRDHCVVRLSGSQTAVDGVTALEGDFCRGEQRLGT